MTPLNLIGVLILLVVAGWCAWLALGPILRWIIDLPSSHDPDNDEPDRVLADYGFTSRG